MQAEADDLTQVPASLNGKATASELPPLSAQHRAVAIGYFNSGDVTGAYLRVYRTCTSAAKAKTRGRAVLQRPEVAEFLLQLRRQGPDSTANADVPLDGRKAAWQAEVERVAYLPEGKGKMPHRDKIAALKLMGEAHDWMPKGVTPQGVRATFIFNVPGMALPAPANSRVYEQAPRPEVELSPALPGVQPGEAFERSEKAGKLSSVSASVSVSDKMSLKAVSSPADARSVRADARHSEPQAVDAQWIRPKTSLFDASNT